MRRPACRWRSPTWQPERVAREATRVSVSRSRSPLRTQRNFPLWRRARKQRRRQGERNGKIMEDFTKAAIRFGGQTCGAGAAPAGCPGTRPVRLLPGVRVNRAGALRQVACVYTYRVILHRGAEHQSKRRETLAYTSTRTHATGPTGVRTILWFDRRHRGHGGEIRQWTPLTSHTRREDRAGPVQRQTCGARWKRMQP